MLTLPIQKKWYDMILSGEKKEEYREIKEYYETRFQNLFGAITIYPSSFFSDRSKYELLQGEAVPDKQYYILEILDKEKLAADEKRVGDEQLEK